MERKTIVVSKFYKRYLKLGYKQEGFNSWVIGVLNNQLNLLEVNNAKK
jgi:hypothetical protein